MEIYRNETATTMVGGVVGQSGVLCLAPLTGAQRELTLAAVRPRAAAFAAKAHASDAAATAIAAGFPVTEPGSPPV